MRSARVSVPPSRLISSVIAAMPRPAVTTARATAADAMAFQTVHCGLRATAE